MASSRPSATAVATGTSPPEISPLVWRNSNWVERTLGGDFDVTTSERITTLYAPDADTLWQKYRHGFGPMDLAVSALSQNGVDAFRQDFRDLHDRYVTSHGLVIDRKALLIRGRRRA